MKLELAGKFEVVFYNGENYYRLEVPGDVYCPGEVYWYMKKYEVLEGTKLVFVQDDETHRLLEGLWFNQVKKGKYDEVEWDVKDNPKPVDEVINRMVEERNSKKLWNILKDKWGFPEDACGDIVEAVAEWLPEPQSAAGSQNAYVECSVEGFNDCLTKIKRKLR
jgi:hypothetical protein